MRRVIIPLLLLYCGLFVACAPAQVTPDGAAVVVTESVAPTPEAALERFPFGSSETLVSGCAELPQDFTPSELPVMERNVDGYTDINAAKLAELQACDTELTLVNVHIPYAGDIPGTDLSIPYNAIVEYLNLLPDKDSPIVLYCLGGPMSQTAAKVLVAHGYTNVLDLTYGMVGWESAGYALERKTSEQIKAGRTSAGP